MKMKTKTNKIFCWLISLLLLASITVGFVINGVTYYLPPEKLLSANWFIYPVIISAALSLLLYVFKRISDKSFKEKWIEHKNKIHLDRILSIECILFFAFVVYQLIALNRG